MTTEIKKLRADAERFCAINLGECCIELNEWRTKGQLRDGKLRELGELCEKYVGCHDGLKNAEAMVDFQACALIATPPSPSTAPTVSARPGQLECPKTPGTRMDTGFGGGHLASTKSAPSTAPTVEVDERAAFEATRAPRTDLSKRGGNYKNPVVQKCWETWQVRAALASRPAAQEAPKTVAYITPRAAEFLHAGCTTTALMSAAPTETETVAVHMALKECK
jgi:hypothetical protein